MTRIPPADFPALLRHRRFELGFSQEALAERAGISTDAVSRYERGLRSVPRRETIALLVAALELSGESKAEFENAAKRKYGSAISSVQQPANNLPWQPTSFIGRLRELSEIEALLAPRRLVTIAGAGGIGKTRIAIRVADGIAERPSDGIWFVDLAALSEPGFVSRKIAAVLDLALEEQGDLLAAVVTAIAGREILLILDNCEHVIDAVRESASAILHACPGVTLLATSRERLAIAGEMVYPLSTMALPDAAVAPSEGRSYEAIQLLVERARAAKHGFELSNDQVEAAVAICRRVDGIALAIELAAARLPALGLTELQTQLSSRFEVIVGGAHGAPARQRTLYAAISWSYDLLTDLERDLFRRLAVFSRGWTIETAEAVCTGDHIGKGSVVDGLISLVEKSLVIAEICDGKSRYSFFESTHAFALEKLVADGEAPQWFRRHAEWIAEVSDRIYDMLGILPRARCQLEIAGEIDSALAALEWATGANGDAVLAGRISSGLRGFWQTVGLNALGKRYLNMAIEQIDPEEHPALVARLLFARDRFLGGEPAVDNMKRAVALSERGKDPRTFATCHVNLGYALMRMGKSREADEAFAKASMLFQEQGLQRSLLYSNLLFCRCVLATFQTRLDEARTLLGDAIAIASLHEDDWIVSMCNAVAAQIEFSTGNVLEAIALGELALASARRVRSIYYETTSLNNLACCQLVLGNVDACEQNAREALDLSLASSADPSSVQGALQHLAAVTALRREPVRAARLLGYLEAWLTRAKWLRDPIDQKGFEILMESLHEQLSDDEIAAAAAEGAQISDEMAVAIARERRSLA